jgi:hypothetical protein
VRRAVFVYCRPYAHSGANCFVAPCSRSRSQVLGSASHISNSVSHLPPSFRPCTSLLSSRTLHCTSYAACLSTFWLYSTCTRNMQKQDIPHEHLRTWKHLYRHPQVQLVSRALSLQSPPLALFPPHRPEPKYVFLTEPSTLNSHVLTRSDNRSSLQPQSTKQKIL